MDAMQQQHLLPEFFSQTRRLDDLRQEDLFEVFPELEELRKYASTP
jgi:hypothetical protein